MRRRKGKGVCQRPSRSSLALPRLGLPSLPSAFSLLQLVILFGLYIRSFAQDRQELVSASTFGSLRERLRGCQRRELLSDRERNTLWN